MAVELGRACPFAILAGTPAVTNVGPSIVTGDVGISPAASVTGFPPGTIIGVIHAADQAAANAQVDLTAAFTAANLLAPTEPAIVGGVFDGLTLVPGVYDVTGVTGSLTGALTFDGVGEYVIRIPTSLTINPGAVMSLINGALAENIFWIVGSSAAIDTTVTFKGSILALTSITVNDGSNIEGKLLARNGTVTLINDVVTSASCAGQSCPLITILPYTLPNGIVGRPYLQQLSGNDGEQPYTFTITSGALPDGLTLNEETGVISGSPTNRTTANFTITATDNEGCESSQSYAMRGTLGGFSFCLCGQ